MARPRQFDTTIAIGDICEKFWADGYEATSIADLESATGLARARLYAAFGSKREMLHRAVDFYLEDKVDQIFRRVDDSGLAGVVDFFKKFAWINNEMPERATMGCLVVNSVIELGNSDPEIAARAERYRNRVRSAFRSALQKASEDGVIAGDVDSLTELAYMMLMGLYVTVKSGASLAEINRLCDIAIREVESWDTALERVPSLN